MKQIILKIQSYMFLAFAAIPLLGLMYFKQSVFGSEIVKAFQIMSIITIWLWINSLSEYMSDEAKNKNYLWIIYLLSTIELAFQFFVIVKFDSVEIEDKELYILLISTQLLLAMFLTMLIKKVFYARSYYFIFIEVMIPFFGMLTLTPEVQSWEEGEKE